ncbi:MAG: HEAT repeat domain-containing protein [Pirellulaceae bacterium]
MNERPTTSGPPELPTAAEPPEPAVARAVRSGLFLVCLFVVSVLVLAWLLALRWLNPNDDPHDLIREMRAPDRQSWQKAYAFSELLRNPRHATLKEDAILCREVAAVLDEQLRRPENDPRWIKSQVFLCRALGEFHVADGLPALLRAAEVSRSEARLEVRCAVLEALAVLAANLPSDTLREDRRVMTLLLEASDDSTAASAAVGRHRVAATATFALGVVGGALATPRLQQLLDDPRPDVRYNAAAGLARQGDAMAIPVLLEMLDSPASTLPHDESSASLRERRERLMVSNAIRAAVRLMEVNPHADRRALCDAFEQLSERRILAPALRREVIAAQRKLCDASSDWALRGGL